MDNVELRDTLGEIKVKLKAVQPFVSQPVGKQLEEYRVELSKIQDRLLDIIDEKDETAQTRATLGHLLDILLGDLREMLPKMRQPPREVMPGLPFNGDSSNWNQTWWHPARHLRDLVKGVSRVKLEL